jgi:drug/metabolite transporter (DMT)-like permease
LRFTVAGALLLPILIYKSVNAKFVFTKGTILAIGAGAPYVLLATYGVSLSSSAHFGTIAPSSMLVFSAIGGVVLFKETLSVARCLGIIAIVTGVISIGALNFQSANAQIILGDVMFVGCGALWASFTLLCKWWDIDSWVATAMVSVVSGVVCAPFALTVIQTTPLDLLAYHGVYQGILVAIFALYCYSKSVAILGSSKGAIFASLVPPVSLILSYIFLDESMTNSEILGSLLIFFGMAISLGVIKLKHEVLIKKHSN